MDRDDQDGVSNIRDADGASHESGRNTGSKKIKKPSGGGTMRRGFRGKTMENNACSTNPPQ